MEGPLFEADKPWKKFAITESLLLLPIIVTRIILFGFDHLLAAFIFYAFSMVILSISSAYILNRDLRLIWLQEISEFNEQARQGTKFFLISFFTCFGVFYLLIQFSVAARETFAFLELGVNGPLQAFSLATLLLFLPFVEAFFWRTYVVKISRDSFFMKLLASVHYGFLYAFVAYYMTNLNLTATLVIGVVFFCHSRLLFLLKDNYGLVSSAQFDFGVKISLAVSYFYIYQQYKLLTDLPHFGVEDPILGRAL